MMAARPLAVVIALQAALIACSGPQPEQEFATPGFPLPGIVERNLPADVPLADVRVRDGCFYYRSGGEVIAVTTNVGGAMLPYCIG